VPTVRGLNLALRSPGAANDLVELTRLQDPLAQIGVGPIDRNGASRPGALPASADSLKNSLAQVSMLRAYSPELTGWFDDFGHSGFPDAFGGIGRISTTLNAFSAGVPSLPIQPCANALDILSSVCKALTPNLLAQALNLKNLRRCPGANERGLTDDQLTQGGTVDCDPSQTPMGP
jgi:hypothetical protein